MKFKILFIFIAFVLNLNANNYKAILLHDGLIDKRAQEKINQIGNEVKNKLNINIYVHILENNMIDMRLSRKKRTIKMRQYDNKVLSKIDKTLSYAVLTIVIDQMYANILLSKDLKNIIDKDDILDNYVVPLLASKDKNSLFAKTSAACLNGYAQIADVVANNKNIELKSSIGSAGKTAGTIWKVFMYSMVLFGIIAYAIIIMRQKKYE